MSSLESIKSMLIKAGYEPVRVEVNGSFKGMKILKDGKQVHDKPFACSGYAIELLETGLTT